MVQRKVPSGKLGIKAAPQIKPDGLGSGSASGESSKTTIRTSSPHYSHPDGKTSSRGPDLKKMKRSRSNKRPNMSSVRSFPSATEIPQPGKLPPLSVRASNSASATPQKQPQVRPADGLPNYMRPTSSSDARKERSSVSPPSTRVASDAKSTRRMSSVSLKMGSSSGNNSKLPLRNLKRSSSLKLMRTLTKTPSFKPARPSSAKRCSTVVLCADMNAQRATCSSTLKDSKFPKYLALSPGATEAEGTSAMKVCPYTYCSLNGHPHSPLQPLKCFISLRRRAIKAQRSLKVEALKADIEEPTLDDEPTSMEADDERNFFIEIYADTDNSDMYNQGSLHQEAKESQVTEKVDFPISLSEEAPSVESFQGKHESELDYHESVEEAGSAYSDMEWDGDRYTMFEIDEAVEHSTENKDMRQAQKLEACPDILLIDWTNIPDEEVHQQEDEARPGAKLPEYQVSEISELSQVTDCFSYDQDSSPGEDDFEEVTADVEETVESTTAEPGIDDAESTGIDPIIHKPQENQDAAIANYSFEQETESSTSQFQCLCQEQEGTAAEAVDKDDIPQRETEDLLSQEQQSHISDLNKTQNLEMLDEVKEETMKMLAASEDPALEVDQDDEDNHTHSSLTEETLLESQETNTEKSKSKYTRPQRNFMQDPDPSKNWIEKNICKKLSEEETDPGRFNPREPNYLPIGPYPEAEKVDLRHQMMDERRNSDEWMIDYALRQTVTRLAPVRKRKVALLVEAFEKVMPVPKVSTISKWETLLTSPRPIQACS